MRRRLALISMSALAAVLVLLILFTPQGAIRATLVLNGQLYDAFTASIQKGSALGGCQYIVAYRTDDPTDRMRPYFFYVEKLTPLGPYFVEDAGTGP